MSDDFFYDYVLPMVMLVAAGVFVCEQYELCVTSPDEWFTGCVAGVIVVLGSWVRSRKRE